MGRTQRVVIYARFSSANQRDRSIDDQVKLCRDITRDDETVVDVITDFAVSGSVGRAGFDRLLGLISSSSVDVVRTESADRLSRDLGDSDRLWKLAKYHRVRLHCVSDGIDSDHRGSRLQYGIKALIADEYIEDLKHKTLRGMHGQFDRQLSTGGLAYGYRSKPIFTSGRKDPDGYVLEIDPEKAPNVVRIFEAYASGHSLQTICEQLNSELIPPPRGKDSKKFWRKTTVRSLLSNRTYVGEFSFGRKKWLRDPVTRKRRYVTQEDFRVEQRPELAIVEESLWAAVTTRKEGVARTYSGKPGFPGRRTAHPFAGLLYCGACGAKMIDGGGGAVRYYRCSQAAAKAGCDNALPVREDVLVEHTIANLKKRLFDSGLAKSLRSRIEAQLARRKAKHAHEREPLTIELRKLEKDIARAVEAIATLDLDPASKQAIASSLNTATRRKQEVEGKLAEGERGPVEAVPEVPTIDLIEARVRDIEGWLTDNPTVAREQFRKGLRDGKLTLVPQPSGTYEVRGAVFLSGLLQRKKPQKHVASEASAVPYGNGSCGGRI